MKLTIFFGLLLFVVAQAKPLDEESVKGFYDDQIATMKKAAVETVENLKKRKVQLEAELEATKNDIIKSTALQAELSTINVCLKTVDLIKENTPKAVAKAKEWKAKMSEWMNKAVAYLPGFGKKEEAIAPADQSLEMLTEQAKEMAKKIEYIVEKLALMRDDMQAKYDSGEYGLLERMAFKAQIMMCDTIVKTFMVLNDNAPKAQDAYYKYKAKVMELMAKTMRLIPGLAEYAPEVAKEVEAEPEMPMPEPEPEPMPEPEPEPMPEPEPEPMPEPEPEPMPEPEPEPMPEPEPEPMPEPEPEPMPEPEPEPMPEPEPEPMPEPEEEPAAPEEF